MPVSEKVKKVIDILGTKSIASIDKAKNELEKLLPKIEELEKYKMLKKQYEKLSNEIEKLKKQESNLKSQIEKLKEDRQKLQEEIALLKTSKIPIKCWCGEVAYIDISKFKPGEAEVECCGVKVTIEVKYIHKQLESILEVLK